MKTTINIRKFHFLKFRSILGLIFIVAFIPKINAQDLKIVKYYDADWSPISKDSSTYFTEFQKMDTIYKCTSYWTNSKKLKSTTFSPDTLFSRQIGLLLRYYENGQLEDSSIISENGKIENRFHYYPSGKLWAHYIYNFQTQKVKSEAYDEKGNLMDNFICLREAEFSEDKKGWINYLSENLNQDAPVRKGAPAGKFQVIISFVVDKDGKLINIKPVTKTGFGTEEEAIRVIAKSPKWIPAILFGKPVKAYRKQPITFVVTEKK